VDTAGLKQIRQLPQYFNDDRRPAAQSGAKSFGRDNDAPCQAIGIRSTRGQTPLQC